MILRTVTKADIRVHIKVPKIVMIWIADEPQ